MAHNAADEKQVNKAREDQKTQRDQELEDIKTLLDTPAGIRFFLRFFTKAKMFQTTFTGNSQTFFLEGQRNIALHFFEDVALACPDKIINVITNIKDEDKKKGAK